MSKHSLNSLSLVAVLALAVFVVAFALLMVVGDYRILASFFMASLIALLASIVLFLGMGSPAAPYAGAKPAPAPSAVSGATAGAAAAGTEGADAGDAAGAEAAARQAEEEAAARRAADEEAARQAAEAEATAKAAEENAARRAAEEEAARKAAEDQAAAAQKAAEAEATEKAAEQEAAAARSREEDAARQAAEEREAARVAAEEARVARETAEPASAAPVAAASLGEDYDGDGVREGVNEGTRPAGIDAPRDGKADDLKQIKGVGPKLEKLCNSLGFWHFDQVAAWTSDEVAWVDANLTGFKGRVSRDEWVSQARILATGGETEFSKRVEDGDVY